MSKALQLVDSLLDILKDPSEISEKSVLIQSCGVRDAIGEYALAQQSPPKYVHKSGRFTLELANLSQKLNNESLYHSVWAMIDTKTDSVLYVSPCLNGFKVKPSDASTEESKQSKQPKYTMGDPIVSDTPPISHWLPINGNLPLPIIASSSDAKSISLLRNNNIQWQQTMYRIGDSNKTVEFYEKNFGMKMIHSYNFPQWKFSLFFMATPIPGLKYPKPGTDEAEKLLWDYPGVTLELTYNHGDTLEKSFNNGNIEPNRGFGHIAFNVNDVYQSCDELDSAMEWKKKPDEGRMKGLAFALDPSNYWIEIVKRNPKLQMNNQSFPPYNLSQTMLRVKDPIKSLHFYCDLLGMRLVRQLHFEKAQFSLYFLATLNANQSSPHSADTDKAADFSKSLFHPILELTHNWGTERDESFKYHSGNEEPKGFGHIGYLVDHLTDVCTTLLNNNVSFKKKPQDGTMRGIAFAYDPDGYWVELIQRGVQFNQFSQQ